ncbi:hypothetical protein [Paracoccus sp. SSK6]|uniref:hypothetical protein n=1 Tax=Paracoccus sp. SSK6 TaxID=3143131 RepID=UPI00321B5670
MDATYWNNNGRYNATAGKLGELIPSVGGVSQPEKNKALEKFRCTRNIYYDYYNNGLCNRMGEVRKVYGFSALVMMRQRGNIYHPDIEAAFEAGLDAAILAAADEQDLDVVELSAHARLARRACLHAKSVRHRAA